MTLCIIAGAFNTVQSSTLRVPPQGYAEPLQIACHLQVGLNEDALQRLVDCPRKPVDLLVAIPSLLVRTCHARQSAPVETSPFRIACPLTPGSGTRISVAANRALIPREGEGRW